MKVEIIEGEVCPDHIHYPLYMNIAPFVGMSKSKKRTDDLRQARAQRIGTICQPRRFCYLPPVNGLIFRSFPRSSALLPGFFQLMFDVFCYSLCILSRCIHIAPSTPGPSSYT